MFGWFKKRNPPTAPVEAPAPEPEPVTTVIPLGWSQWTDLFYEESVRCGLLAPSDSYDIQIADDEGNCITAFTGPDEDDYEGTDEKAVTLPYLVWTKWVTDYLETHPLYAEVPHESGNPLRACLQSGLSTVVQCNFESFVLHTERRLPMPTLPTAAPETPPTTVVTQTVYDLLDEGHNA